MTHVLVPVDGSEHSLKALEHAVEQFSDAQFTVLHIVDALASGYGGTEMAHITDDAVEGAVARGERITEDAVEHATEAGANRDAFETVVEWGRPAHAIVRYAEDHDVDQIVIASTGRSGISRVLLGSVAEVVVRRATVPVTVVR